MTPVDKTSQEEKDLAERQEDLRYEWIEEDIELGRRKPNLEEIEDDSEIL